MCIMGGGRISDNIRRRGMKEGKTTTTTLMMMMMIISEQNGDEEDQCVGQYLASDSLFSIFHC